MTRQVRLNSDGDIYNLSDNGWHVPMRWQPPAARLFPLVAGGVPSPRYLGGDLIEEWAGDITTTIPLKYVGSDPETARRGLEAYLRRAMARRQAKLEIRQERAFDTLPLWGQWGAWNIYEIVHAGALEFDTRIWPGETRRYVYADLTLRLRPWLDGQNQSFATAKGDVSQVIGDDGLHQGVTVGDDGASLLTVPASALSADGFTLIMAWQRDDTTLSTNHYLLNSWFYVYYAMLGGSWFLGDGLNNSSEAMTLPAVGETIIFHIVFDGTNQLDCYINGVRKMQITTTFSSQAINITTDIGSTSEFGGVTKLLCVLDGALTATQIAADAIDVAAALDAGPSPSPIPYIWTDRGTWVFDNARDDSGSTGAPHYNYGWISGLAGTLPAPLLLDIQLDPFFSDIKALYLSLAQFDEAFDVLDVFADGDIGTEVDAASWGGNYRERDLDFSNTAAQLDISRDIFEQLAGKRVTMFLRGGDTSATANLVEGYALITAGGGEIATPTINLDQGAGDFGLYRFPGLIVPELGPLPERLSATLTNAYTFNVVVQESDAASGTNDHYLDAIVAMPGAIIELSTPAGTEDYDYVSIYEGDALLCETDFSLRYVRGPAVRRGDVLRPHPHRQNLLMALMGAPAVDPLISWYFTILQAEYTPRWSVI